MGVVNVMEEEGRSKIPSMWCNGRVWREGRAQRRLVPFFPIGVGPNLGGCENRWKIYWKKAHLTSATSGSGAHRHSWWRAPYDGLHLWPLAWVGHSDGPFLFPLVGHRLNHLQWPPPPDCFSNIMRLS